MRSTRTNSVFVGCMKHTRLRSRRSAAETSKRPRLGVEKRVLVDMDLRSMSAGKPVFLGGVRAGHLIREGLGGMYRRARSLRPDRLGHGSVVERPVFSTPKKHTAHRVHTPERPTHRGHLGGGEVDEGSRVILPIADFQTHQISAFPSLVERLARYAPGVDNRGSRHDNPIVDPLTPSILRHMARQWGLAGQSRPHGIQGPTGMPD